jgi:hypothetical protein
MVKRRYWTILIISFALFIVLTSCQRATTERLSSFEKWAQTPIPEATLYAYDENIPVTNKMQAVIAARAHLLSSRVQSLNDPRVVSVEFINYEDAIIRMQAKENGQHSSNEKVWLVDFEGDFDFSGPLRSGNEEVFFANVFVMLLPDEGILVTWKKLEPSYPSPSQSLAFVNTPMAYPYPVNTTIASPSPYANQQTTTTSLPVDMTPVPASKEVLAIANKNFGRFFQELPFVNDAKREPHREYYGCINSQNAGSIINYIVTTQTAENIMIALTEFFDKQEIKHTNWEEFDISGFLGYSWKISASYHPNDDSDALVIVGVDLLDYKLRATPESPEVTPTEDTAIPESHVYLWLNYFETPGQITGHEQTDLLKTCEDGWWLAINP